MAEQKETIGDSTLTLDDLSKIFGIENLTKETAEKLIDPVIHALQYCSSVSFQYGIQTALAILKQDASLVADDAYPSFILEMVKVLTEVANNERTLVDPASEVLNKARRCELNLTEEFENLLIGQEAMARKLEKCLAPAVLTNVARTLELVYGIKLDDNSEF